MIPLAGEPAPVLGGPTDHPGYVGQRAVFAGDYLFVSYSAYNVGWSKWHTYGCDLGKCYDGALFRYRFDGYGNVIEALDVTPPNINQPEFRDPAASNRRLGYGLSGISADRQVPGTLICSTITVEGGTLRVL